MKSPKESSKCGLAKINHTDLVIRRMSQLLMSNIASDVVFIVEGERLLAHKCFFAAGNKYFEDLLYGELSDPKQNEFELKEVPVEAFRAILGYIYSGQMCLLELEDHLLDILRLAQKYNFEELQRAIIKYLQQIIVVNNAWPIFDLAWLCEMEDLKSTCYAFMDRNASNLLAHESLNQISKEALEDVLRRDTFLAPEFEIFTAVSGWCKHHEEVDVDSVLSYVRLPLISLDELLKLRRLGVLKEGQFIDALEKSNALKKLPYRVWRGRNMSTLELGAKIIEGSWVKNPPPPGDIFPHNGTSAVISANVYQPIVVELGIKSIINNIQIKLNDQEKFSYFVEVAPNKTEWEKIVDYRDCNCKGWQQLYFPPKFLKCIKIVGTRNTGLKIADLVASYKVSMLKQIDGFLCATIEISGLIEKNGVEHKGALLDPHMDNYHNYYHTYNYHHMNNNHQEIHRNLDQPYFVSALRIFFSDGPNSYNYSIQVSVNETDWSTVVSKQNELATSWRNISFPPRPVVLIKISSNKRFRSHYDFNIVK